MLFRSTGLDIPDESALLPCMVELAAMKKEYDKVKCALDEVAATGYGIVMPSLEELSLEEPEIIKQGGRYGVRLKASAPSIHMMAANITTEVNPIVGSPNTLYTQQIRNSPLLFCFFCMYALKSNDSKIFCKTVAKI